MKSRLLAVLAGLLALAGAAAGFLLTVQVVGPHGRAPRYGAAAATPPAAHLRRRKHR